MDDPRVKSALSRLSLDSSYVGEDEAKQILHVKDDHAFIWSRKDSSLLAIGLNQQQQEDNPVQTISLTDSPMFEVERICSSLSGKLKLYLQLHFFQEKKCLMFRVKNTSALETQCQSPDAAT